MAGEWHSMQRINPAFFHHPKEAEIIGRMVVSFGEMEYGISNIAAYTTAQPDDLLRVLYRISNTSSRISAADFLLRPICLSLSLIEEYEAMHSGILWCLATRNRYAHCNWGAHYDPDSGVFFVDLQSVAEEETGFDHNWRHLDLPLLKQQEEYFAYVIEWLDYLDGEIPVRRGLKQLHASPKPQVIQPPLAHNLPSKHIPHWISAAQRARHKARAAEEESAAQRSTRKLVAQEKRKQEKLAKKAESDRRSQAKDPNAKNGGGKK
jgi:hypothetical protein